MSGFLGRIAQRISAAILHYLDQRTGYYEPFSSPHPELLRQILRPGDVLLIEGNTRLSAIIKYLTQSTWSHATLYVGPQLGADQPSGDPLVLIEANVERGVALAPLSKYTKFNTRICRPTGLGEEERRRVLNFALANLGKQYDSRHIVDLLRYLFPYPPVPVALRRRMLAIGSGDPTRAICSTLIAQAFYSVNYPILPALNGDHDESSYRTAAYVKREIFHIKKSGLFTPRDFDVSPYFDVVKPFIEIKFDYHTLIWEAD